MRLSIILASHSKRIGGSHGNLMWYSMITIISISMLIMDLICLYGIKFVWKTPRSNSKNTNWCFWFQFYDTFRRKDRVYSEDIYYGKGKALIEVTPEELAKDIAERKSENPAAYRSNFNENDLIVDDLKFKWRFSESKTTIIHVMKDCTNHKNYNLLYFSLSKLYRKKFGAQQCYR